MEKIYVHFDKPFYILGEVSWYKVYVVAEPDLRPSDISSVVNLDWIDPFGNLIKHQRLKVTNGGAAADFTIDTTLSEGIYTVRAYTNWMRNENPELFFTKRIQLFSAKKSVTKASQIAASPKIDFQFFPEGGTIVAGIETQIAFKAIDVCGKGTNVNGKIIDEQGTVITSFKSIHNGMGTFPLLPQISKSYRAVLQNGEVYPLPFASENGLVLSAYNMYSNKISIRIQSIKNKSSVVYLIGQSHAAISYAGYIKLDSSVKDIFILKDQLPEGVLQLTLFNSDGIPQCERKLFIRKEPGMVVSIQSNKEKYSPRDSIILNFKVNDNKGSPGQTLLSISVTDANLVTAGGNTENIYTRLLLQSDIQGYVENPAWYFNSRSIERVYALDLVMLTHGWSRYSWEAILALEKKAAAFKSENGIHVEGKIIADKKPVANTPFILMIGQAENSVPNIYETDSLGQFIISDLDFFDSSLVSFRVMGRDGVMQNAKVQLTAVQDAAPIVLSVIHHPPNDNTEALREKITNWKVWEPPKYKILEKVVVKQPRKLRNFGQGAIAVKPDARDLKSRVATSQFISRYARSLPFVKLRTMPDGVTQSWDIMVNRNFYPLRLFINGILEETNNATANPYLLLNSIPIEDIEEVFVARRAVISVWTKNTPLREKIEPKHVLKGYDAAREFYHPKYGPSDDFSPGVDNRATLYWNPNLQTNKEGMATIKFYNTDYTQALHIVVEGISNGLTIFKTQLIGKHP